MLKKIDAGLCAVADLALPRTCEVCGRKLFLFERFLCLECLSDIPYTFFWTMRVNPMADKFNGKVQEHIRSGAHETYIHCASLFFYSESNSYKNIPQTLKYGAKLKEGSFFARELGRRLKDSPLFEEVDAVIPVPLHWIRRWRRGYNQSEVIAKELSKELGARMRTDILRRRRYTGTQTRLSAEKKVRNVSGAFKVMKKDPSIHHILLVDDTFTTGSTLYECFRTLRERYTASVKISVVTLCYVSDGA